MGSSVDIKQEYSANRHWAEPDEIDLTRYVGALTSRWLEILLTMLAILLLTAGALMLYRSLMPPVYESAATVAIVRTASDVSFDERFTTGQAELDVDSRRLALVALVNSGEIAQQVIDELGDALPSQLQDPAELLDHVQGEIASVDGRTGQSDLFNIRVRTDSPAASALIANAWAKIYVQQVNSIYGQVPDEMLSSVAAQQAKAQKTYAEAQALLENYVAASKLDELVRQSEAVSQTLAVLQATQLDAVTSQNDRLRSQLRVFNDQWVRTNGLLTAAHTLSDQVNGSAGADFASLALALQMLQVQMINAAAAAPPIWLAPDMVLPQSPTEMQLQIPIAIESDPAALAALVRTTVASLEAQLATLQENIAQTSQAIDAMNPITPDQFTVDQPATGGAQNNSTLADAPLAATIAQLEQQRRAIEGQIEVESAAKLALTTQRDLAWQSLLALNNKQAEMLLTRAAANSEVRLSSVAIPLHKPVEQVSLFISLMLATIGGLLAGVLLVIVLEILNIPPLRSRGLQPRAQTA